LILYALPSLIPFGFDLFFQLCASYTHSRTILPAFLATSIPASVHFLFQLFFSCSPAAPAFRRCLSFSVFSSLDFHLCERDHDPSLNLIRAISLSPSASHEHHAKRVRSFNVALVFELRPQILFSVSGFLRPHCPSGEPIRYIAPLSVFFPILRDRSALRRALFCFLPVSYLPGAPGALCYLIKFSLLFPLEKVKFLFFLRPAVPLPHAVRTPPQFQDRKSSCQPQTAFEVSFFFL